MRWLINKVVGIFGYRLRLNDSEWEEFVCECKREAIEEMDDWWDSRKHKYSSGEGE